MEAFYATGFHVVFVFVVVSLMSAVSILAAIGQCGRSKQTFTRARALGLTIPALGPHLMTDPVVCLPLLTTDRGSRIVATADG